MIGGEDEERIIEVSFRESRDRTKKQYIKRKEKRIWSAILLSSRCLSIPLLDHHPSIQPSPLLSPRLFLRISSNASPLKEGESKSS